MKMMKLNWVSKIVIACLFLVELPSLNGQIIIQKKFNINIDGSNNYDKYCQRILDLVNKTNSQLSENKMNTNNKVFVREFSISTDEQGFLMFKSKLATSMTIIDSSQTNTEVTKDTMRINEELKLCELNKMHYLKTLDTMSPVSKNYERINRELSSVYSKIL